MRPRSTSPKVRRAAAAVVAVALLASCDTTSPPARPDGSSREIPSGGAVSFGVLGEPPTLDPYSSRASDLTYFLARPVYRSLYRVLPDGVVEPDLAESLEPVRNGVVVTLERARWSDGSPITASDLVESVGRAEPPSGFVGLSARAIDRRRVRIRGRASGDWARRLAIGTFVLPGGRHRDIGSGPFVPSRYTPGLELVLEPNPRWTGETPHLDRIKIRFVATLGLILELLDGGRLDAASPPSAVNLGDRLDEAGFEHAETLGRETIAFDLDAVPDRDLRAAIVAAVDRGHIAEGLIRDEGTTVDVPVPEDPDLPATEIQLGVPSGDELLQLMQRILQKDLARQGIKAELLQVAPATFYGEWKDAGPLDVAVRREMVPGFDPIRVTKELPWFPLYSVDSVLTWVDGINGLEPNANLDGPLWNVEEWWRE